MSAKLSQSEILRRLGYTPSRALTNQIDGNGKLQQFINQKAALQGLPEPFNPSFASALTQDLIPLAALAGGALLSTGDAAGGSAAASTAEGAGGGGAASAASKITSAATNVPTALETAGVIAAIWTALTNPSHWLRALEILGAVVAIYLGVRSLTGGPSVIEAAEKIKP